MDMVGPQLLATLCALVVNACSGRNKPARVEDFAPWLETPASREKRPAEGRRTHMIVKGDLVAEAYMRKRKQEDARAY